MPTRVTLTSPDRNPRKIDDLGFLGHTRTNRIREAQLEDRVQERLLLSEREPPTRRREVILGFLAIIAWVLLAAYLAGVFRPT
jgi:hypothetical protein